LNHTQLLDCSALVMNPKFNALKNARVLAMTELKIFRTPTDLMWLPVDFPLHNINQPYHCGLWRLHIKEPLLDSFGLASQVGQGRPMATASSVLAGS
jgi:hypothetical protein